MRFEVPTVVNMVFWDMMPWSEADRYQHFGETYCVYLQDKKTSNLKMEATDSYEMFISINQTTHPHFPQDHNLSGGYTFKFWHI
jgi:hypothetical protein